MSINDINQRNALISLIGSGIFAILTVIIPVMKVGGGFLTYSELDPALGYSNTIDFFWDEITVGTMIFFKVGISYSDMTTLSSDLNYEFIWKLIPIWGIIYVTFGIFGAILIAYPGLQVLRGTSRSDKPISLFGLLAGLVGTGVEYLLFVFLWQGENWGSEKPEINGIILLCFIIGWITLFWGYFSSIRIKSISPIIPESIPKQITREPLPSPIFCPNCGYKSKEFSTFCESCGKQLK
ncbi:MAG: zinc ribbon domain-containing protein [Candidatus Hodarchaeales archaeon]